MAIGAGKQCRNIGCPNLQPCPIHGAKNEDNIRRQYYQKWYYRKRWKSLREVQLRKEPYCVECLKEGRQVAATEVDHIIRHQGDPALFYNQNNLQSLCKPCHSRKTIKEVGLA